MPDEQLISFRGVPVSPNTSSQTDSPHVETRTMHISEGGPIRAPGTTFNPPQPREEEADEEEKTSAAVVQVTHRYVPMSI